VRPAGLLGSPVRPANPPRSTRARPEAVTAAVAPAPEPMPTVEIIRGDKRAEEVVR
jgi:hypothetical protein